MRIFAVVPAYRAEWCLRQCLAGLIDAGFSCDDIVVVDDGSPDRTADIARQAGVRLAQGAQRGGAAAARNVGAKIAAQAGADVLMFVDSDVVVRPDARQRVEDGLTLEPGVDALFGAYDNSPACPNIVSQYRNLLHHHVHMNGPHRASIFWTGCGAIRVASFQRVGGFDPDQHMMEDVEFGHRLSRSGGHIRLDPYLQGKHLKCWSLPGMIRMDIFDRAIPWSRLMLCDGQMEADFNLSISHRLSAVTVLLLLLSLGLAVFQPAFLWMSATCLLVFCALNITLFQLLYARMGWWRTLAAVPLHMIHYGCAMAGLGTVLVTAYLPRRLFGKPQPG